MGYYSDVAIECDEKARKLFEECFEAGGERPDEIFPKQDTVIMFWGCKKWYSSIPYIAIIEDVMNRLDDAEDDANGWYYFLRLGEERSDVEERYSGDFWYHFEPHIEIGINILN